MMKEKDSGLNILQRLPDDVVYLILKRLTILQIRDLYRSLDASDKFSCLNRTFFRVCLKNNIRCDPDDSPIQRFDDFLASTSGSNTQPKPEASFDYHLSSFTRKLSTSSKKSIRIHFRLSQNYLKFRELLVVESSFDLPNRQAWFTLGCTSGNTEFYKSSMELSTDFDRISTCLDHQNGSLFFTEIKELQCGRYGMTVQSKSLLDDLDSSTLLELDLLPLCKPMMTVSNGILCVVTTHPNMVKITRYDMETGGVTEKDVQSKNPVLHIIVRDDTMALLFNNAVFIFKMELDQIIERDRIYCEPIKLNETSIIYTTGYWPNDHTRLYNVNMLYYKEHDWKKKCLQSIKTILPMNVPKTCSLGSAVVLKSITSQIMEIHYMMRGRTIFFQEHDAETPRLFHKDKLVDKTLFPKVYRLSYGLNE